MDGAVVDLVFAKQSLWLHGLTRSRCVLLFTNRHPHCVNENETPLVVCTGISKDSCSVRIFCITLQTLFERNRTTNSIQTFLKAFKRPVLSLWNWSLGALTFYRPSQWKLEAFWSWARCIVPELRTRWTSQSKKSVSLQIPLGIHRKWWIPTPKLNIHFRTRTRVFFENLARHSGLWLSSGISFCLAIRAALAEFVQNELLYLLLAHTVHCLPISPRSEISCKAIVS